MPDNAWYYFMWWQLIILPQRGGLGWQRLSAGGMNIATGPRWNKDRWVRTSNGPGCTPPPPFFLLQSPGVGTVAGDLTCELNAFKQLLPCQKEAAPAASLENASDVRRDETRLGSVSVSLLWD